MELGALLGTWINSNPDTHSVAVVKAMHSDGKLKLQVSSVGPDGFVDWGVAEAQVFAATPESDAGAGFTCRYEFSHGETRLQGMIMKGLLVLAQFHLFKDNSDRESYFLREYFAATHDRFAKVNS
ncbi:MAG TPA: hypothetical protein VM941_02260 [Pyrinomonadaceae bacterium]|jgi:hypothetical protein|nr:hypothetical protein [Pyrinomonadaceae bacterium]